MNSDKTSTSGSIGIAEIGSIGPAEIMGYDTATQQAVNAAVSRATNSSRQWTRQTLYAAYKAARPIVEASLRAQGQAFTKSQARAALKPYVAAYVTKYAVITPPGTTIGATQLQAIAGDVCGYFTMPWTAFMPPQVQLAAKLAEAGNPKAKGWLSRLFGGKSAAPAASPAASPVVAAPPSTTPSVSATSEATDEKLAGWSWNPATQSRQVLRQGTPYGNSSNQDEGTERRRHHRHHHHHRDNQQVDPATGQPYSYATPAINPTTGQPYTAINPVTGQPYVNPATGQPYNYAAPQTQQVDPRTGLTATGQPASSLAPVPTQTTYNPYLPPSINPTTGQPYGAINPSTGQPYGAIDPSTGQPYTADSTIYGEGKVGSGDSLGHAPKSKSGAWTQKLNPLYWLHSSEERKLIDSEKQAWIDNAYNQKQNEKKQQTLDLAQKALVAKQASAAAYAKTAEMEAQLKSIESQVLGACSGCSKLGREDLLGSDAKPDPFAGAPDYEDSTETLTSKDVAPVVKKIAKARQLNADNGAALKPIVDKLSHGAPLSPEESSKLLILLARNEQLHEFRKNLVSGEAFAQSPVAKKLKSVVVMGAVKAMTPTEQLMLAQMVALAKQGNPNAKAALSALQSQGYAATMGASPATAAKSMTDAEKKMLAQMIAQAKAGHHNSQQALMALKAQGYTFTLGGGHSFVGWGISDAFKVAMLPITVPTKYAWKGTKAVGRAIGFGSKGQSADQARLARMQSAQARVRAAQARARAADAQSEAEYRAQQQLAAAADAEADAADAEATAKEAAMMTAEAQYLPGQAENSSETDDSQSGDDVAVGPGKKIVKPIITPLPPTSPKDADLERLMQKATKTSRSNLKEARRQLVAKKNPQAARILAASETSSPAGMKLQAAMKLYAAAKQGDPKARRAVANMVAKAKKGDKQALADVYAMKAAQVAVKADTKAAKHVARVAAYRAQSAKVIAARKRVEVATANKLTQASRAHGLARVAKIERRAAAGDKKSQAVIKKQVALAKAGNKPSQNFVKAAVLAKHIRTTAPTRAERQRVAQARRMAAKIARGDKKSIRDYRVMAASAKAGNPNAKRGVARVATGAAIDRTIKTGMVVLPAVVITAEVVKKQEAKKAADQKKLVAVETKVSKGTASKEEVQAAAKIAANEGDHEKAKELMTVAASTPSAKDELARVATVVAASEAGNPKSQQSMARALQAAEAGAPEGIEAAGKIAAVQALHQVSADKPIAPEMKTAVADLEAAQAGDPAAQKKLEVMKEQASFKIPEAVKYMTYATGASVVGRALADNPVAHDEWLQKAGVKPEDTSTRNTNVEDEKSLAFYRADEPLPPVRSAWEMFKASLAALFLATPDPFQNYREGVQARSHRALGPVTTTGDDDSLSTHYQTSPHTHTMFTYDQPDKLYWPGGLDSDRFNEIVKRAKSGDKLALAAVAELKSTGAYNKAASQKAKKDPEEKYMVHGDSSPDPFQNYREGVQARSHRALGPVTTTGWVPSRGGGGQTAAIAIPGPDMTVPGLLLAWPIIALIEYFSDKSDKKAADAQARAAAAQAVNEAIAKGLTSGQNFINATYLTFGWDASHGSNWKQNTQVDMGVPEVRQSVVQKVRAGDPKAVAFYRAVLKTGYTPSKSDPGLLQLSGDMPNLTEAFQDIKGKYVDTSKFNVLDPPDPKLVDLTKRRLGDIKTAADKGDADAKKKWATSNTNYTNKKALAAKGDPKATAIVAVLEATGLFKS